MQAVARTLALLGLVPALPVLAQETFGKPGSGISIAADHPYLPPARRRLDRHAPAPPRRIDQDLWYRSSEDYAKCARETFQKERTLIAGPGLLAD